MRFWRREPKISDGSTVLKTLRERGLKGGRRLPSAEAAMIHYRLDKNITNSTGDLALVAACRTELLSQLPALVPIPVYEMANVTLTLITDILKQHALSVRVNDPGAGVDGGVECLWCGTDGHPCRDYQNALTTLHAIAESLGVDPDE